MSLWPRAWTAIRILPADNYWSLADQEINYVKQIAEYGQT